MASYEPAGAARTELKDRRASLLTVLADIGVAAEDELRAVFAEATGNGERFGEALLRRGWLDEALLARALAQQWELPFLEDVKVDLDAAVLLPSSVANPLQVCAVSSGDGRFTVAVSEPSEERFEAARHAAGGRPAFAVITQQMLDDLLRELAAAEEYDLLRKPATTERVPASTPERVEGLDGKSYPTASRPSEPELAPAREGAATKVEEIEQSRASLDQIEHELADATAQLVATIVGLIAAERDRAAAPDQSRAELNSLRAQHAADEQRIRDLESRIAQHERRTAEVKTRLAEATEALGE